ncbi:hypothetical protein ACI2J5_00285 [Agrobacterium pusense]|uniref:hypothetical protein n=1 Tax=Agrobacterium pusense TaxID=648995 RepID=UPI00384F8EBF
MDWKAYRNDLIGRKAEAEAQLKWMRDNNVTTRQRTGLSTEWTDITERTVYEQERVIDMLDKLITLINQQHLPDEA